MASPSMSTTKRTTTTASSILPKSADSLENYDLIKIASRGRFSVVYKAERLSDHTIVALKRISRDHMDTEAKQRRVAEELRLASALDCRHIARYMTSFMNHGELYIVLAWCDGGDLKRLMRRHREADKYLSERLVLNLFVQLMRAVAHMHERKIIHRDLKPANCLLCKDGTLKVCDFGLGRILLDGVSAHSRVGTPMYMAPEVLLGGEQGYDGSNDIWSAGCILYELCALRHPFASSGGEDEALLARVKRDPQLDYDLVLLIRRISRAEFDPLPQVLRYSDNLKQMINSALSLEPSARPSSQTLLVVTESYITEHAVAAGREPRSPKSPAVPVSTTATVSSPPVSPSPPHQQQQSQPHPPSLANPTIEMWEKSSSKSSSTPATIGSTSPATPSSTRLRPSGLVIPSRKKPATSSTTALVGFQDVMAVESKSGSPLRSPEYFHAVHPLVPPDSATSSVTEQPKSAFDFATSSLPRFATASSNEKASPRSTGTSSWSGLSRSRRYSLEEPKPPGSAGLIRSPMPPPTPPLEKERRASELRRTGFMMPSPLSNVVTTVPIAPPPPLETLGKSIMSRVSTSNGSRSPNSPTSLLNNNNKRKGGGGVSSSSAPSRHSPLFGTPTKQPYSPTSGPPSPLHLSGDSSLINKRSSTAVDMLKGHGKASILLAGVEPRSPPSSLSLSSPHRGGPLAGSALVSKVPANNPFASTNTRGRDDSNPFMRVAPAPSQQQQPFGNSVAPLPSPTSTTEFSDSPKPHRKRSPLASPKPTATAMTSTPSAYTFELWKGIPKGGDTNNNNDAPPPPIIENQQQQQSSSQDTYNSKSTSSSHGSSSNKSSVPYEIPAVIIGDMIGEGSFARVYRAVDSTTGSILAVKELELMTSKVESVVTEIGLLSNLKHPNLVRYLGSSRGPSKHILYVHLEFCNGGSIAQMLHQFKSFPERLIRLYTRQMVEALVYLHSRGIVHRDIKGGNVLVDGHESRGVVKLSDFGTSLYYDAAMAEQTGGGYMAGMHQQPHSSRRLEGTVLWMAPEVARQAQGSELSPASDIWSLGATVIEMATGYPPWKEEGFDDPIPALYRIATTTVPPHFPQSLSPAGHSFLTKCMAVDAKERATAKQLILHSFLTLDSDKEKTPQTAGMTTGSAFPVVGRGNEDHNAAADTTTTTAIAHVTIAEEDINPTTATITLSDRHKKFSRASSFQWHSAGGVSSSSVGELHSQAAVVGESGQSNDVLHLAECRLTIVRFMHMLANLKGSVPDQLFRDLLQTNVKVTLPVVMLEGKEGNICQSLPLTCPDATGVVCGQAALMNLGCRPSTVVKLVTIETTREMIDLQSHTALWGWELNGSWISTGKHFKVLGTASASFTSRHSWNCLKEVQIQWEAQEFWDSNGSE